MVKVSEHGTIGLRTFFEFLENISPRLLIDNCNNLDKKRNSEETNRKNVNCSVGMSSEVQF